MAHSEQMHFVAKVKNSYPDFFIGKKVLEVGSYDINGTVRHFFEGCDYTGIDVAPGKGVDVVCPGQDFDPGILYDTIISCEMLEHNPFWVETLGNMARLLTPGGLLILSCATTGRPEHGTKRTTPLQSLGSDNYGDYYRNITEDDIRSAIDCAGLFESVSFAEDHKNTHDLYMVAVRKETAPEESLKIVGLPSFSNYMLPQGDTYIADKPIHLFYHMYCVGNFLEIFDDVRSRLRTTGLGPSLSLLHVVAVGPEVNRAIEALLGKSDGIVLYTPPGELASKTEAFTLNLMKEYCTYEDIYAVYLHGKGVTVPHDGYVVRWREYLLNYLFGYWQSMVQALGSFDAVGVQLQDHANGPHFSGNFWWTSSAYMRSLPPLADDSNRYSSEFWVGSAAKAKLLSLHYVSKNLYEEIITEGDLFPPTPYAFLKGHKAVAALGDIKKAMEQRRSSLFWY